jgi:hypothetical protein
MEIVLIIVVIGAALLLFYVVARWIYAPRKNTRRLAMEVTSMAVCYYCPHGQNTHPALRYLKHSGSSIGVGLF